MKGIALNSENDLIEILQNNSRTYLFNGEWGTGKSYLIEKSLKALEKNEYSFIYLSLFQIKNLEDIYNFLEKNTCINIEKLASSFDDINTNNQNNEKKCLIVFDDFERKPETIDDYLFCGLVDLLKKSNFKVVIISSLNNLQLNDAGKERNIFDCLDKVIEEYIYLKQPLQKSITDILSINKIDFQEENFLNKLCEKCGNNLRFLLKSIPLFNKIDAVFKSYYENDKLILTISRSSMLLLCVSCMKIIYGNEKNDEKKQIMDLPIPREIYLRYCKEKKLYDHETSFFLFELIECELKILNLDHVLNKYICNDPNKKFKNNFFYLSDQNKIKNLKEFQKNYLNLDYSLANNQNILCNYIFNRFNFVFNDEQLRKLSQRIKNTVNSDDNFVKRYYITLNYSIKNKYMNNINCYTMYNTLVKLLENSSFYFDVSAFKQMIYSQKAVALQLARKENIDEQNKIYNTLANLKPKFGLPNLGNDIKKDEWDYCLALCDFVRMNLKRKEEFKKDIKELRFNKKSISLNERLDIMLSYIDR